MVEPKYPGVVEQYINLGKCYDHNGMEGLRTAIISCMRGYKGHYQRAYRCLDAAAELMYDVRSTLDSTRWRKSCPNAPGASWIGS